jgi:hypothetical protein
MSFLRSSSILRVTRYAVVASMLMLPALFLHADEGMFPLSEIAKLNLKAKGLKIDTKEIYNPNGISLVQAICDLGGGTGEFVSADGLILTNHHIAFPAVAAASTTEHDYLKNGFTAFTREQEIPAQDYICNICEGYKDVSAEVLSVVTAETPAAERAKAIRDKMNAIAKAEEAGRANISCRVAEMFPGKSYVLFTYRSIKDVRLVYVPPIGVGNFGGENDNWVWPRHTGDFSFLRAYVAPDGSTAAYAKNNVPFKPKRHLKIAPKGVKENDFVMVLGYPGRTYRHKTSHYMRIQEQIQLPYIADWFDLMIKTMDDASRNDRALQLKFATQIKSFANVTKNYRGKLQGLRRLHLVEKKVEQERQLQAFIDKSPDLKTKFGAVLADIAAVYEKYSTVCRQELLMAQINRNRIAGIAQSVLASVGDPKRSPEALANARTTLAGQYDEIHFATELKFLATLLENCASLPADQQFISNAMIFGTEAAGVKQPVELMLRTVLPNSILASTQRLTGALEAKKEDLMNDPFIRLAMAMQTVTQSVRDRVRTREGELNRLEALLLDAKMAWQKTAFIPDANSTLRLTYGYVRGYAPADATRYSPFTTLKGIIEKNIGAEPYDAPQELVDLYNSKSYDKAFEDQALKDVPVAMIYNLDTTGGNSGSPVMNARGELVGVNFDRAYEATINDYQWSEDYSRSIAVDIRYVLFIAKYLGKADFLLKELGV